MQILIIFVVLVFLIYMGLGISEELKRDGHVDGQDAMLIVFMAMGKTAILPFKLLASIINKGKDKS